MPQPKKAGADWVLIEQQYRHKVIPGLMSLNALAKEHPVSRQAISQRAEREGWPPLPGKLQPPAKVATDVAASDEGKQVKLGWKDTPGTRETIFAKLRDGCSRRVAALAAGISPDTLTDWMAKDSDFSADVAIAEGQFASEMVGEITKAAKRGEWRAADRHLQTHGLTKDQYGQQAGGNTFKFEFNIDRGNIPGDDAKVIEG